MAIPAVAAPIIVTTLAVFFASFGNEYFVPNACERLQKIWKDNIVGQDMAKELIISAICQHLSKENPEKPLIFSLHGPPGTGKTFTHYLTAKALYGVAGNDSSIKYKIANFMGRLTDKTAKYIPGARKTKDTIQKFLPSSTECPGNGCPAYKVLYGMNYLEEKKEDQYEELKKAIIKHLKKYKQSILVIEDLDKFTCDTRIFIRQFLNHPQLLDGAANSKSIIFFESNLGMYQLAEEKYEKTGTNVDSGMANHQKIKKLLFDFWNKQDCDDVTTDIFRTINNIDLFVAYLPLNRRDVKELILMNLKEIKNQYQNGEIIYDEKVVMHLMQFVQFDGDMPINGARDIGFIVHRYIGQALRYVDDTDSSNSKLKLVVDKGILKVENLSNT